MYPNSYFFAPVVCWNFFSGNLDFHKGPPIHGWLSKLVFSRGSWTTAQRPGAVYRPLQDPQSGSRSVYLLPEALVGEISPGSLGIWCWIPQLPQRCLYSRMDAELLLWGQRWRTSYATIVLMSLFLYVNYDFASLVLIYHAHMIQKKVVYSHQISKDKAYQLFCYIYIPNLFCLPFLFHVFYIYFFFFF